jgi:hypothetical protein
MSVIPIKNSIAKGTSGAGTAKEKVPYLVRESRSLRIGSKACGSGGSTKANCDNLALGLTGLNSRGKERALRKLRIRKNGIVVYVASLDTRVSHLRQP